MKALEEALYARMIADPTLAFVLPGNSHRVGVTGATGGTFTLSFGGGTTAAIAYDATAATVQARLAVLAQVGAGNVGVSGNAGGPWEVTFAGELADSSLPLTGSGAGLVGAGATLTVAQRAAVYNTAAVDPPDRYLVFTKIASAPGYAYGQVATESYRYQFAVHTQGSSRAAIEAALGAVHSLLAFGELTVSGRVCWGTEKVGDGPALASADGGMLWQSGSADYRVLLGD
jgi:hypothetical protein